MARARKCGTCRWWRENTAELWRGYCNAPIPESVRGKVLPSVMFADAGEFCAVWKAKPHPARVTVTWPTDG